MKEEIETIAADIGENIYIDVAKWHLYLSETNFHITIAEQAYPLVEKNTVNEEEVLAILQGISVQIGDGKINLSLSDLIPTSSQDELVRLLKEYQRN